MLAHVLGLGPQRVPMPPIVPKQEVTTEIRQTQGSQRDQRVAIAHTLSRRARIITRRRIHKSPLSGYIRKPNPLCSTNMYGLHSL